MSAEKILMALLLGGIATGCVIVLYPFLSAMLWAAILVFSSWPLFRYLRGLGLGRVGAAVAMVTLTAIVVVLPIALAAPDSIKDVVHVRALAMQAFEGGGLPAAPAWLPEVPLIGPKLNDVWSGWSADIGAMVAFFRPYFGILVENGIEVLLRITHGVISFVLALFISLFFYIYGEEMTGALQAILRRIAGEQADRLIAVTGLGVRGTVYGIIGTALVLGILTYIGLRLSGVPRAPLLSLVTGLLAMLPIGAPLVWISSAIWLLASGRTGWGIFLAIYGTVVISGSDHLMRPFFIARGAKLPFLLTLLGLLGGALAFGLLGIFLGPVLLGVGLTLVREFASRPPRPASDPPAR